MKRREVRRRLEKWGGWPEYLRLLKMEKGWAESEADLREVEARIAAAEAQHRKICEVVGQLTPIQIRIIRYRYVDRRSWRWVAVMVGLSETAVRNLERAAVDRIGQRLGQ